MQIIKILEGIRVIDLGFEKAAYGTKLLSDLGAEVIKIEPLTGSVERRMGPFAEQQLNTESSLFFEFYNGNKKLLTVDLSHPLGQEIVKRLVEQCDVLVESFAPGVMNELGLGYDDLAQQNSRLIYASVTGFGQTGPKSAYEVTDLVAFAAGGLMQLSGSPTAPPVKAPGQQAYDMTGIHACIGVLMALLEREESGVGQCLDLSMQEVMAAEEHNIAIYSKERRIVKRVGSQHQVAVPGKIFRCKDGYVHLFVADASPKAWGSFMEWMGYPEALSDAKWANGVYRREHSETVDRIVEKFTLQFTKEEITAESQRRHIPCVPVNTSQDLLQDEHFSERRFFVHDEQGGHLRFPFLFNDVETVTNTPNTKLGSDNYEILHDLLQLSDEEILALAAGKVI